LDFRIKQLQCFLTLADLLHYGRTARMLYMSQPTITFQIKSLEETFGVKLFERDRQQVRLTEAGRAFREHAQCIIDIVHAAEQTLHGLHTRLRLRISCGPVGQYILLPAVIRKLAADYPDFKLEVNELTTEQQISRLPAGRVDVLLMVGALPIEGSRFEPICRETLIAMVSRRSPLALQRSISIQDLRHVAIIASRLRDCRFHQPWLRSLLEPHEVTPRIIESPQSCTVQFAYAAAGEGVAIATESMAQTVFPGIVALPFRDPMPQFELGFTSMDANDTAAVSIFRKVVMECASETLTHPVTIPLPHPTPPPAIVPFPARREAS
jgi:DNA-binding transcriptional LysR family regulator